MKTVTFIPGVQDMMKTSIFSIQNVFGHMHKMYLPILTFVSTNLKNIMKISINLLPKEKPSISITSKIRLSTFLDLVPLKYLSMEHSSFPSFNQIYGRSMIELLFCLKKLVRKLRAITTCRNIHWSIG